MSELHFDVAGAAGPRAFFSRANRETLAHAYLFAGNPGVGKKTFARRLAQSLLCSAEHPQGVLGYDGTCSSCRLFEGGENTRHPDFIEHDGVLKIGDPDAAAGFYENEGLSSRDIVRLLALESYSGGLRVLLLGDVEFATLHAANALLKFLEDPPSGVVLILTSASPGRLLGTIRSRLVEVRFSPLSHEQLRDVLVRQGCAAEEAERGAAIGQGSVSRALAALDGDESSLRAGVARWFFTSVRGGAPDETWATRETLDDGLEIVKSLARDWIAASAGGGTVAPLAADYARELAALPAPEAATAVAVLAKIDDAQRLARTNVSPVMVGEIVRMALTGAAQ